MLTTMHLGLMAVASVVTAALLVVATYGLARDRFLLLWIDRLILADLGVLALTSLVGPALLLSGEQPKDGLHFLYAAAAWLALPIGRVVSASAGSVRSRGVAIAIAALALLGVLVRLYMTGAGT